MNFSELAVRCAQAAPTKLHVVLPLFIMGALHWLSSVPGMPLPDDPALYALFYWVPPSAQNVLHVPAFATLGWAWCWALGAWLRAPVARAVSACGISSAYGALDEWHQSFVPGRFASLTDVALDFAGAVLGVWLAAWMDSRARLIEPQINVDKRG